jgi:hypothetical protein
MDVHIQEVVATVRTVNSDALLTQRTLTKIVGTVLGAVRAEHAAEQRRKTDRRVTNGARDEQEGEAG